MKTRDIATIACAITGLFALFMAVPLIQTLVTFPFYAEELNGTPIVFAILWAFPALLLILLGFGLIIRRGRVAAWILLDSEFTADDFCVDEIQDLAFAMVGLYFVISTLPDLGSLAGTLINLRANEGLQQFAGAFRSSVPYYVGTLLKLVAGAYLFFYAHSLARLWRRRRSALQPRQTVPSQEPARPRCPRCGNEFAPSEYRPDLAERFCSKCHNLLPNDLFDGSI